MKRFLLIVLLLMVTNYYGEVQGSYNLNKSDGDDISSKGIYDERVGDLFTMDIRDIALVEVLTQISDRNGITFLLPPSLAEEKVMVRFSNLRLDKGLSKIFQRYNSIFIYSDETNPSSQSSTTTLEEVRIYLSNKGKNGKETPLVIKPGSSKRMAKDENMVAKRVDKIKEEGENSVEDLLLYLQDDDSRVRIEAVKALAKIDDDRVIRPLSLAAKDGDQGVKKEAEKALKVIGESLKVINREREEIEKELNGDDSQNVAEGQDEPGVDEQGKDDEPAEGEKSVLALGPTSGNAASLELNNEVPVRGVQFTLEGAQPVEVRTTSRSEGFFAQFNKENGTVIMVSLSGDRIKPGTGPIAEIVCDNTGSASLSGVKIVE